MVKVYIAASSHEAERAAHVSACLLRTGLVEIDDRWWTTAHEWAGKDSEWSRDDQHFIALGHIVAIDRADIFWMLYPSVSRETGALTELGAALAFAVSREWYRPRLIVTGLRCDASVFTGFYRIHRALSDSDGLIEACRIAHDLHALGSVT